MIDENAHPTHQPQAMGRSLWPIVLAATLTITMIGLLASQIVAVVGAVLSVVSLVAWLAQPFHGPAEAEEHGPTERVRLPELTAQEVETETPLAVVRSLGWWGMVWFIATEATFFAFMIAAYVYLRARAPEWPPQGTPPVELAFPIINTVILLASGIPAFFAHRAIRRGDRRGLQAGLAVAALLGAIFLGGQIYEYMTAGFTPQSNIFGAGFFVLTGFHGIHVLVGVALLVGVLIFSLRGSFSAEHHFGVEFASTYWHFVDIVWIFLFALLYLFR